MGKGAGKGGEAVETMVSGNDFDAKVLAPQDEFIGKLVMEDFRKDIDDLGKKLAANQGPQDLTHLNKIIMWSRLCSWIGALTCWVSINPLSIFLMSVGTMTRWAIIGHHICHGGFDKCSEGKYNRFKFAVGSVYNRCKDWLDWMLVEAWNMEHNQLHHYHLGEETDPDLVEMNLAYLRDLPLPTPLKYVAVFWMMCTWKWWYYAPNTYKQLKVNQLRRAGKVIDDKVANEPFTLDPTFFIYGHPLFSASEFMWKVLGPYFFVRFVLTPLPFFAADFALNGSFHYATNALISLAAAEVLTNIHSFVVIATNHAGDDLYRFNVHCKPHSGTFYLRQVLSSANFRTGGDLNDFMHGWLNYQVEHHMWPQLSMRSYQRAQPLVKAICAKHGVPYVQQNVFWRLKKLTDIMVGSASMRKYPVAFEHKPDLGVGIGHDQ
jgi:fatty acid desaturase